MEGAGVWQHTRFIELAGEINTAMPEYVVHRVADALNTRNKAVKGSRVLILGLAYKLNVDDERVLIATNHSCVNYQDLLVGPIALWTGETRWRLSRALLRPTETVLRQLVTRRLRTS